MKTVVSIASLCVIFVGQCGIALAGELSAGLSVYKEIVAKSAAALPFEVQPEARETNEIIRGYLRFCLANASQLDGLELDTPGVSVAFQKVGRARFQAYRNLPNNATE